jgi:hypothetical protein
MAVSVYQLSEIGKKYTVEAVLVSVWQRKLVLLVPKALQCTVYVTFKEKPNIKLDLLYKGTVRPD